MPLNFGLKDSPSYPENPTWRLKDRPPLWNPKWTTCDFLRNDLPRLLPNISEQQRGAIWFEQDGTPPYYCRDTRNIIDDIYSKRWTGRGVAVNCPARTPDMTQLDFFLWGFVTVPTTLEDMDMLLRIRN